MLSVVVDRCAKACRFDFVLHCWVRGALLLRTALLGQVFAENTTKPIALSNSARPGGADGDRTFTLIQGLRIQ